MGAPRTSADGDDVVGGEAEQVRSDDARPVDAPGRIIVNAAPAMRAPTGPLAVVRPRDRGRTLVIAVYVFATIALAAALYERFVL